MRSSQHSFWRAEGTQELHSERTRTPLPLFASLLLHCGFGSFLRTGHLLAHSCSRTTLQLQSFLKRHKTRIWKREQNTPETNSFLRHFLSSTKRDSSVGYNWHEPSGAAPLLLHAPLSSHLIFYKLFLLASDRRIEDHHNRRNIKTTSTPSADECTRYSPGVFCCYASLRSLSLKETKQFLQDIKH